MAQRKRQGPSLSWPGKTQTRSHAVPPLFLDFVWGRPSPDSWPNLLVRGDNLPLLSSLIHGPLRARIQEAGGIKLVYIDPPFAVGTDFTAPRGGVNALAYRDTWDGGINAFLSMIHERLLLIRDLLAEDGSLFLHCDYRTVPYLRLLLEEVFGRERFLGEIIWHYTGGGRAKRWFSRKHDTILHFSRSSSWYFNPDAVRVAYKSTSGYARGGIVSASGKRYMPHPDGTPVDDVWNIPMINPMAAERTGYPTQKPEALLERILLASSRPGDLVADFFCGSGTTAVVAQRLGRRWLCADKGALAVEITANRLLAANRDTAFAVAALGGGGNACERDGVFRHKAWLALGELHYTISDINIRVAASGQSAYVELLGMTVTLEQTPTAPGKGEQDGPKDGRASGPVTEPVTGAEVAAWSGLPDDWTGWLGSWRVGVPFGEGPEGMTAPPLCDRALWHSGNGPDIPLRSEMLAPQARTRYGSHHSGLIVTIVDIFANVCRVRVPV